MLQNLKKLEENNAELLDPSFLFERNIIFTRKSKDLEKISMQDYSWLNSFQNIDLNSITKSILKTHEEFFSILGIEESK